MAKLNDKALRERDATRDIGAELLASVLEMKAGKAAHVHRDAAESSKHIRQNQIFCRPRAGYGGGLGRDCA